MKGSKDKTMDGTEDTVRGSKYKGSSMMKEKGKATMRLALRPSVTALVPTHRSPYVNCRIGD
jgi:hypothetical protein